MWRRGEKGGIGREGEQRSREFGGYWRVVGCCCDCKWSVIWVTPDIGGSVRSNPWRTVAGGLASWGSPAEDSRNEGYEIPVLRAGCQYGWREKRGEIECVLGWRLSWSWIRVGRERPWRDRLRLEGRAVVLSAAPHSPTSGTPLGLRWVMLGCCGICDGLQLD